MCLCRFSHVSVWVWDFSSTESHGLFRKVMQTTKIPDYILNCAFLTQLTGIVVIQVQDRGGRGNYFCIFFSRPPSVEGKVLKSVVFKEQIGQTASEEVIKAGEDDRSWLLCRLQSVWEGPSLTPHGRVDASSGITRL